MRKPPNPHGSLKSALAPLCGRRKELRFLAQIWAGWDTHTCLDITLPATSLCYRYQPQFFFRGKSRSQSFRIPTKERLTENFSGSHLPHHRRASSALQYLWSVITLWSLPCCHTSVNVCGATDHWNPSNEDTTSRLEVKSHRSNTHEFSLLSFRLCM